MAKGDASGNLIWWGGAIVAGFLFGPKLLQAASGGARTPSPGTVATQQANRAITTAGTVGNSALAQLLSQLLGKGGQSGGGGKSGGGGSPSGGGGNIPTKGDAQSPSSFDGSNVKYPESMPQTYDQRTAQYANVSAPDYSMSTGDMSVLDSLSSTDGYGAMASYGGPSYDGTTFDNYVMANADPYSGYDSGFSFDPSSYDPGAVDNYVMADVPDYTGYDFSGFDFGGW